MVHTESLKTKPSLSAVTARRTAGEEHLKDLRVLFATNHAYPPQRVGGSESSTHDLCIALKKHEIPVAVLAAIKSGGLIGWKNRVTRKLKPGQAFPADRGLGYPVYRGRKPKEGIREVVDAFRPNVAIVQAGEPLSLAYDFVDVGVPTLVYLRDIWFDQLGGSVRQVDGLEFVANSAFCAGRFESEFGIQIPFIPPLVDPQRYRTETTRGRVVFINPDPRKGLEIVLKLAERCPEIDFDFVEAWPLSKRAMDQLKTRTAGLKNVRFRKRVADMRIVYGEAKVVLVPSTCEESWGRVVTEAQVSGIPILASNRGGLTESVGPGGILVDADAEVSAWETALRSLWEKPEKYKMVADAARQHSRREGIQPERIIADLLERITSLRAAAN